MTTITLEKAQQDLPDLVKRALAGEEIVIASDNRPAVRLLPVEPLQSGRGDTSAVGYRGRGILKGKLVVGPEFFEPLSDEECGLGPDEAGK